MLLSRLCPLRLILFFFLLLAGLGLWSGCARPVASPAATEIRTGIAGEVLDRRKQPVAGAWVYAYRNTSSSLRGPADFAAQTDAGGHYFLDLVEGHYYLIARWRNGGGEAGPPQAGDAWAIFAHNPLQVVENRVQTADFSLHGVQSGQPALLRDGSLSRGRTGFTGTLVDAQGQPLPGAFVLAYADADFRRMPDYTSALVGSDGHFELFLPAAGRYCLAARTRSRGQPVAGEPYGQLGSGEKGCINAVENQMIDVGTIHLRPYQR
jgi:hypothetical protein